MDKELKELQQFSGTEQYTRIPLFKTVVTDGVSYIMNNGYSWFVTDVLAVIEHEGKVKGEEFLSIKLKLNGTQGTMVITDGDDKVLYRQEYKFTDAKVEVEMFATNGVMMLTGEY